MPHRPENSPAQTRRPRQGRVACWREGVEQASQWILFESRSRASGGEVAVNPIATHISRISWLRDHPINCAAPVVGPSRHRDFWLTGSWPGFGWHEVQPAMSWVIASAPASVSAKLNLTGAASAATESASARACPTIASTMASSVGGRILPWLHNVNPDRQSAARPGLVLTSQATADTNQVGDEGRSD